MSTIDVGTVLRLAEGIKAAGGRYLEAPISGSKKPVRTPHGPAWPHPRFRLRHATKPTPFFHGMRRPLAWQAEEGRLVVMAAGDAMLYDELQPVFALLAKHTFFLGECGQGTLAARTEAGNRIGRTRKAGGSEERGCRAGLGQGADGGRGSARARIASGFRAE